MDLIERFLPKLSQLKHFELQAENFDNSSDGQRWQMLTQSLVTFNFKLRIKSLFEKFNSFRTSFWLEEKHWLVVYDNGYLYTVPRFAPTKWTFINQLPIISTLSNDNIFYQSITELILSAESCNHQYRFTNIKLLKMNCSMAIERLFNLVDLSQVKHLILSSRKSISIFLLMLPSMPLLNELTIRGYLVPSLIEDLQDNIVKQIQKLNLDFSYFERESITEILGHLLPCIEYLNVSLINSTNDIVFFIQQFKHLLNASFGINSLFKEDKEKNCQDLQKTIEKKFTCQIAHSSN